MGGLIPSLSEPSDPQPLPDLALKSPSFTELRSDRRRPYVDKTGAVADLLNCHKPPGDCHRVFFTRPRKFGKSLTMSTAAAILSAGKLPENTEPWVGYSKIDVDDLFGGLSVHRRLQESPASLCGLLQEAHFVVNLSLGRLSTGAKLESSIKDMIGSIAYRAFRDKELEAKILNASSAGSAIEKLIDEIPSKVPVALLIDGEYRCVLLYHFNEPSLSCISRCPVSCRLSRSCRVRLCYNRGR